MTDIIMIICWILITLVITSFAGVIGKRYGVQYIISIMAALIVIINAVNAKMVMFGPFIIPAGTLLFATTFLITDIISEQWGKRYAKQAIWAGFYASVIFVITVWIALAWEPAAFAAETSEMFAVIFSLTPRIVLASMIAYLIGQHHDVWAFHFWKKRTNNRHLWLRNNASTAVSQLVDSVLFATIAFYGVVPNFIDIIIGIYVVKLLIAFMDTPFIYGILRIMDKVAPTKQ